MTCARTLSSLPSWYRDPCTMTGVPKRYPCHRGRRAPPTARYGPLGRCARGRGRAGLRLAKESDDSDAGPPVSLSRVTSNCIVTSRAFVLSVVAALGHGRRRPSTPLLPMSEKLRGRSDTSKACPCSACPSRRRWSGRMHLPQAGRVGRWRRRMGSRGRTPARASGPVRSAFGRCDRRR